MKYSFLISRYKSLPAIKNAKLRNKWKIRLRDFRKTFEEQNIE